MPGDLKEFINFYKTVSKASDNITLDEVYNLLTVKGEINSENIIRIKRQLEVNY